MAAVPPSAQEILRGLTVSSISLVTFTIGALLVFMRMYVRNKRRITGWDEYTICVALVIRFSGFTPWEAQPCSQDSGTISLGYDRRRVPSCEWHRLAYQHLDAGPTIWIHQVDLRRRSRICDCHMLCQDLRVHLNFAPGRYDSTECALLHLCAHGILDRLDRQSGHCLAGSVQTTKGALRFRRQGTMLFKKRFCLYCILAGG